MWFIDTVAIDGLALRQWMGSVDETIVAKHAARMGLVCPNECESEISLSVQVGSSILTSDSVRC